jgi:hypothetical protein
MVFSPINRLFPALPFFQPGWADKGRSSMPLASLWLRNSLAVICQILIIAIRKKEIADCTRLAKGRKDDLG